MRASLDEPENWNKPIRDLLERHRLWDEILCLVSGPEGPINRFLLHIETGENECPLGAKIRHLLNEELSSEYESVTLTHACREYDWCTYRTEGILKSRPSDLIKIAKQVFGNPDCIDKIIRELSYYGNVRANCGKVGLLLSANHTIKNGTPHTDGPEILRLIASRLNTQKATEFLAAGTPCLIECEVPISWLPESQTCSYIRSLFSLWIGEIGSFEVTENHRAGGLMLNQDVPVRRILRFISR